MADRRAANGDAAVAEPADRLHSRYAAHRDPRDLEKLVLRYRPLAHALARRYSGHRHPLDDLAQVACVGLIKALQRFDPARGCSFASFAVPTILGEIRRFCRDTSWSLHMPRGLQERILAVRRAADAVTAARGRTGTVAEVAAALGWERECVVEALLADSSRSTIPLETEIGDGTDPCPLADVLGEVDPAFELVESLAALEESMSALTRAEQRVLRLRFEEDLTLREVGSRLALRDGQVSQLLSSALRALRQDLGLLVGDEGAPPRPTALRRRGLPLTGAPARSAA